MIEMMEKALWCVYRVIENIKINIFRVRMAIQRATRGYSDDMWWSIDEWFIVTAKALLIEFYENADIDDALAEDVGRMVELLIDYESINDLGNEEHIRRGMLKPVKKEFAELFFSRLEDLWD